LDLINKNMNSVVRKGLGLLLDNRGREGHWSWKWKFRTIDRAVQFNPDE